MASYVLEPPSRGRGSCTEGEVGLRVPSLPLHTALPRCPPAGEVSPTPLAGSSQPPASPIGLFLCSVVAERVTVAASAPSPLLLPYIDCVRKPV